MSFLIDTNVISEMRKPRPDANVVRWVLQHEDELFLSVVTVAELWFGVDRISSSEHRDQLEIWVGQVIEKFGDRLVSVDTHVAETWGKVMARSARAGRMMAPMDCFLAATALVRDLTLVTRDVGDFSDFGGKVFSPWTGG